jgi:hypothetical protein
MSAFVYGRLTRIRSSAALEGANGGLGRYIDALAALVPSEVLALHAVVMSVAAKTQQAGPKIDPDAVKSLQWSFGGFIVLSLVLYLLGRGAGPRSPRDWLRAAIPPVAFIGWSMLQRTTVYDAFSGTAIQAWVLDPKRTIAALFSAVVLGAVSVWLANGTRS